jgi:hypothetical protein
VIWKRTPAPPQRPGDDEIMQLLGNALAQLAPPLVDGTHIRDGCLVGAQGWALMALPNHTDDPRHFDIGFVESTRAPDAAVIPDCISGIGSPEQAAGMMAHIWQETSGACLAELLTRRGEYATHLDSSDPAGLPGWHTVVSGVLGYGADQASSDALRDALFDNRVLRTLAPQLLPALDRPAHNGIKVFYQRTPTGSSAEIRVNGRPDQAASEALAALPWPPVAAPAIARFYAVAVRPS